MPIAINPGGGNDAVQTAEIMNGQKSLDVNSVQQGDIVWYRIKNGTNYLFAEGRDIHGRLMGPLESIRTDGRENKRHEVAYLNGSTTGSGGILKPDTIVQNLRVELVLPNPEKNRLNRKMISTPVADMGIIKPENIPLTPTP